VEAVNKYGAFLRKNSDQQNYSLFNTLEHSPEFDGNSLCSVSRQVEEFLNQKQTNSLDDVATTFLFSIICAPLIDVISSFLDLLDLVKTHFLMIVRHRPGRVAIDLPQ
jgi:nucleolar pre-ribosomal-associated protein 1